MTCGCKGRIRAHPSAPLRDRVTRPSDRASYAVSSLRAGTDLRGESDNGPVWLQTLCGIAILLIVAGYHIATWRL